MYTMLLYHNFQKVNHTVKGAIGCCTKYISNVFIFCFQGEQGAKGRKGPYGLSGTMVCSDFCKRISITHKETSSV